MSVFVGFCPDLSSWALGLELVLEILGSDSPQIFSRGSSEYNLGFGYPLLGWGKPLSRPNPALIDDW